MAKWLLQDHRIIANELSPKIPAVVLIDKSLGKWLLNLMNEGSELEKKIAFLREDKNQLRIKIAGLEAKLARWQKYMDETGVGAPKRGTRKKVVVTEVTAEPRQRKPGKYKEKMCPGCGSRPPHPFQPRSGRQEMCDTCREELKHAKSKMGKFKGTLRTTWRGTTNAHLGAIVVPEPKNGSEELLKGAPVRAVAIDKKPVVEPPKPEPVKKLSVEEVLRMPDGPEKKALEAKFTIAEKMEAAKVRFKLERENWKKMRNKGFALDNPIVGVGLPKPEPDNQEDDL